MAEEILHFTTARSLMQKNNEALKLQAANVESKREDMDSLKFLGGPTFSVQAMELWGELQVDIDRSVSTPLGAMPVDISERYNYSGPRAAVTGTLPIYSGGKISAAQETSRYALAEAEAQMRAKNVELDVRLIGKYFGLQLALSLETLRRQTLAEQEREVARARSFMEQGLISQVEYMGVEVSRDAAKRNLLKASDNVSISRRELASLLLVERIGKLGTPLFVLAVPLQGVETWIERAIANNPRLAEVDAQVHMADQGVNVARGNYAPEIFAFGQYNFIRPWQTMIEPTWLAGIGMNLTLWSSRDRSSTYKSARATLRKAKAAQADVMNAVRTDVEVAWLNTRNAIERYKLTASTVGLAEANLKLKNEGFAEGLNTALDVREARDQLLAAEVERRVAAFEFVANYAMLHAISGQMDDFLHAYDSHKAVVEK